MNQGVPLGVFGDRGLLVGTGQVQDTLSVDMSTEAQGWESGAGGQTLSATMMASKQTGSEWLSTC